MTISNDDLNVKPASCKSTNQPINKPANNALNGECNSDSLNAAMAAADRANVRFCIDSPARTHSSENVKHEWLEEHYYASPPSNHFRNAETNFIEPPDCPGYPFDRFIEAYQISEPHLNRLLKEKVISKRNLQNMRLLMEYYFYHMNAVTSDGKPWRVYDYHILDILKPLGFGSYAFGVTLKKLRIAGYMSVQLLKEWYKRDNAEAGYYTIYHKRFFSIIPIFDDFHIDPDKRVYVEDSIGIVSIKRKKELNNVK